MEYKVITMHQEKNKKPPFWSKMFKSRPKAKIQEDIKEDLEKAEAKEDISIQDKQELESMEEKLETVNKVEEKVEESIDKEREGILKRFFKKLNFGTTPKEDHDVSYMAEHEHTTAKEEEHHEAHEEKETVAPQTHITEDETRETLKRLHTWVVQLPPEKLEEFKKANDFKKYTTLLKKYQLIK